MENLLIVHYQNLHILHPICTIIKQLIILQGEKQEVRFYSAIIIFLCVWGGGGGRLGVGAELIAVSGHICLTMSYAANPPVLPIRIC